MAGAKSSGRSSASRKRETAPGSDDAARISVVLLDNLVLCLDGNSSKIKIKVQQSSSLVGPGQVSIQSSMNLSTSQSAAPYSKLELVGDFVSFDRNDRNDRNGRGDRSRGNGASGLLQVQGQAATNTNTHVQQCLAVSFESQSHSPSTSTGVTADSLKCEFGSQEEWELLLSSLFQKDCYGSCVLSTSLSLSGSSSSSSATVTDGSAPPISGRLYPTGKKTGLLVLDVALSPSSSSSNNNNASLSSTSTYASVVCDRTGLSTSTSHGSLAAGIVGVEKDLEKSEVARDMRDIRDPKDTRDKDISGREHESKSSKDKVERRAGRKDRQDRQDRQGISNSTSTSSQLNNWNNVNNANNANKNVNQSILKFAASKRKENFVMHAADGGLHSRDGFSLFPIESNMMGSNMMGIGEDSLAYTNGGSTLMGMGTAFNTNTNQGGLSLSHLGGTNIGMGMSMPGVGGGANVGGANLNELSRTHNMNVNAHSMNSVDYSYSITHTGQTDKDKDKEKHKDNNNNKSGATAAAASTHPLNGNNNNINQSNNHNNNNNNSHRSPALENNNNNNNPSALSLALSGKGKGRIGTGTGNNMDTHTHAHAGVGVGSSGGLFQSVMAGAGVGAGGAGAVLMHDTDTGTQQAAKEIKKTKEIKETREAGETGVEKETKGTKETKECRSHEGGDGGVITLKGASSSNGNTGNAINTVNTTNTGNTSKSVNAEPTDAALSSVLKLFLASPAMASLKEQPKHKHKVFFNCLVRFLVQRKATAAAAARAMSKQFLRLCVGHSGSKAAALYKNTMKALGTASRVKIKESPHVGVTAAAACVCSVLLSLECLSELSQLSQLSQLEKEEVKVEVKSGVGGTDPQTSDGGKGDKEDKEDKEEKGRDHQDKLRRQVCSDLPQQVTSSFEKLSMLFLQTTKVKIKGNVSGKGNGNGKEDVVVLIGEGGNAKSIEKEREKDRMEKSSPTSPLLSAEDYKWLFAADASVSDASNSTDKAQVQTPEYLRQQQKELAFSSTGGDDVIHKERERDSMSNEKSEKRLDQFFALCWVRYRHVPSAKAVLNEIALDLRIGGAFIDLDQEEETSHPSSSMTVSKPVSPDKGDKASIHTHVHVHGDYNSNAETDKVEKADNAKKRKVVSVINTDVQLFVTKTKAAKSRSKSSSEQIQIGLPGVWTGVGTGVEVNAEAGETGKREGVSISPSSSPPTALSNMSSQNLNLNLEHSELNEQHPINVNDFKEAIGYNPSNPSSHSNVNSCLDFSSQSILSQSDAVMVMPPPPGSTITSTSTSNTSNASNSTTTIGFGPSSASVGGVGNVGSVGGGNSLRRTNTILGVKKSRPSQRTNGGLKRQVSNLHTTNTIDTIASNNTNAVVNAKDRGKTSTSTASDLTGSGGKRQRQLSQSVMSVGSWGVSGRDSKEVVSKRAKVASKQGTINAINAINTMPIVNTKLKPKSPKLHDTVSGSGSGLSIGNTATVQNTPLHRSSNGSGGAKSVTTGMTTVGVSGGTGIGSAFNVTSVADSPMSTIMGRKLVTSTPSEKLKVDTHARHIHAVPETPLFLGVGIRGSRGGGGGIRGGRIDDFGSCCSDAEGAGEGENDNDNDQEYDNDMAYGHFSSSVSSISSSFAAPATDTATATGTAESAEKVFRNSGLGRIAAVPDSVIRIRPKSNDISSSVSASTSSSPQVKQLRAKSPSSLGALRSLESSSGSRSQEKSKSADSVSVDSSSDNHENVERMLRIPVSTRTSSNSDRSDMNDRNDINDKNDGQMRGKRKNKNKTVLSGLFTVATAENTQN